MTVFAYVPQNIQNTLSKTVRGKMVGEMWKEKWPMLVENKISALEFIFCPGIEIRLCMVRENLIMIFFVKQLTKLLGFVFVLFLLNWFFPLLIVFYKY